MGNAKSKDRRPHAGHERLDENDKRYFAKVQARNSTKEKSRRFRKPHPVIAMKSCVHAMTSIDPPQEDDESLATNSNSPSVKENKPYVGPLPPKMKDDISSTASSFSRVKPTLSSISEREASPTTVVLPSPRGHIVFPESKQRRKGSTAQRRLEKARANQIRPTDSFPSDLSITSSHSSTTHNVIQDYYTEMLDEAHRESRQATAEGRRDSSRTFDSLLPNGMVWAEVTRGGRVTCVAFSRCDTSDAAKKHPLLMAIGTDDGTVAVVEIMDVPSSPLHRQIEFGSNQSKKIGIVKELPREGTVRSVDFSPDGRWLMVAGDDCMACLMRINLQAFPGLGLTLSSVEMVQEFEREDRVYCVQFSNDGKRIAMGGYDGIVAIVSMNPPGDNTEGFPSTHSPPLTLVDEIMRPGLMLCLDWSPDGKMLAVGGSHKCCMIIEATSGKVVGEVLRGASVETVKWKPDGTSIAIGSSDGVVAIVNAETHRVSGELVRGTPKPNIPDSMTRKTVLSRSRSVNSLCWSPDGRFLAIAGSDNCCAIVETSSFALLHEIRRSDSVTCVDWKERRLLTGDEGRYLAIGSLDRTVAIMKTGVVNEEEEAADSVAESDDSAASSSYFSIGSGSLSQHEWVLREDSFRDVEEVESFSHTTAPFSPLDNTRSSAVVGAVTFSRHRKGVASLYMAIAYSNGCITVVSTKDWSIMKQLTFSKTIKAIHFSRKSDFMALGGDDGSVCIISTPDWSIVREIKITSSSITALRFSRRNERLAVGSSDGIVTLLIPESEWKIAGEIEFSDIGISCIDWSSRHLAIGRFDGTVSVHEASRVYANFFLSEAEVTREGPVHAVSFGVGGQFLAVGDANGKVGIYSAKGGWVLCHQLNTPSAVIATKWSSDGQFLAFGGEQREMGARVVDTVAWTSVKEMHKLDDAERFSTLDWSNDDKWMVIACSNGSLHVIDSIDWNVRKSFPGLSIASENGIKPGSPDSTQSIDSKETENGTRKYHAVKSNVPWRELAQVSRFLVVSRSFVGFHHESNPPLALRPLLKCVLMLTIHVQWVNTKDNDVVQRISQVDDGEPAAALLWILGLCTDAMKQAMLLNSDSKSYSPSFGLTPRDLRRIQAWNDQWLLVDSNASCIDVSLLQDADRAL